MRQVIIHAHGVAMMWPLTLRDGRADGACCHGQVADWIWSYATKKRRYRWDCPTDAGKHAASAMYVSLPVMMGMPEFIDAISRPDRKTSQWHERGGFNSGGCGCPEAFLPMICFQWVETGEQTY